MLTPSQELKGVIAVLKNKNADLNEIYENLECLQCLCKPPNQITLDAGTIADLRMILDDFVQDNRSRLVLKTADTIICLSENMKESFEPIATTIFRTCIDKVAVGNSTIAGKLHTVCDKITEFVIMRRAIPYIITSISNRCEKIALTSTVCLKNILNKWPSTIVNQFQDFIVSGLKNAIESYSGNVRQLARTIYKDIVIKYPALSELVYDGLSQRDREKLPMTGTMSSTASSIASPHSYSRYKSETSLNRLQTSSSSSHKLNSPSSSSVPNSVVSTQLASPVHHLTKTLSNSSKVRYGSSSATSPQSNSPVPRASRAVQGASPQSNVPLPRASRAVQGISPQSNVPLPRASRAVQNVMQSSNVTHPHVSRTIKGTPLNASSVSNPSSPSSQLKHTLKPIVSYQARSPGRYGSINSMPVSPTSSTSTFQRKETNYSQPLSCIPTESTEFTSRNERPIQTNLNTLLLEHKEYLYSGLQCLQQQLKLISYIENSSKRSFDELTMYKSETIKNISKFHEYEETFLKKFKSFNV